MTIHSNVNVHYICGKCGSMILLGLIFFNGSGVMTEIDEINFFFSVACRKLVSSNMGVRCLVPLQKLHPLSRAIHHRYSGNNNPQRPPHRMAARHFTSMSRLPMRPPKPAPGSWGRGHQQQRNFWVARLAARLLRLRYLLLGTAVGGGYTAKKVSILSNSVHQKEFLNQTCLVLIKLQILCIQILLHHFNNVGPFNSKIIYHLLLYFQTYEEWKDMLPDFSEYSWIIPDSVWELSEQIDLGR